MRVASLLLRAELESGDMLICQAYGRTTHPGDTYVRAACTTMTLQNYGTSRCYIGRSMNRLISVTHAHHHLST